jgi:hypothetical protein
MASPLANDDTKPNTKDELYWKVINTLSSIFIFLTLTATMWSMSQINEITKEIASIKASRFTVHDGVVMAETMTEMQKEYSEIIMSVSNKIDLIDERTKKIPPEWVVDDLRELKDSTKKHQEKLSELSAKIDSIESRLRNNSN